MKRAFILLLIATAAARVLAQDAVALAAQREQEENYKRLSASIESAQEVASKQESRISALAGEVDKLRTDVAKANNNAATHDAIKRLNDEILKVDKKRAEDNERIEKALEQLKKLILDRPSPPPPPRTGTVTPNANSGATGNGGGSSTGTPRTPTPGPTTTEEGFEYIIQKGDTLDAIVGAYRKQGVKVTSKQVIDANPTVKWNALRINQKIFIPKPK